MIKSSRKINDIKAWINSESKWKMYLMIAIMFSQAKLWEEFLSKITLRNRNLWFRKKKLLNENEKLITMQRLYQKWEKLRIGTNLSRDGSLNNRTKRTLKEHQIMTMAKKMKMKTQILISEFKDSRIILTRDLIWKKEMTNFDTTNLISVLQNTKMQLSNNEWNSNKSLVQERKLESLKTLGYKERLYNKIWMKTWKDKMMKSSMQ